MELILRGSEYESFLNCRKQWYYRWVLQLQPKRPDGKLFFGNLFHKWLEYYYYNGCNKLQADMDLSIWFNHQNMKEMEQNEIDDMKNLFFGVSNYYHKTYGEVDKKWKVLGTEVKFFCRLDGDIYYTGTIDMIYEVDGKIRFMDHKTVASIQMYEDKSKMDRQISRYWWVMKELAAGRARIWDEQTESWVRFNELIGKEIDGFDYNLIGKDFPKEPKVLKPKKGQTVGKLSEDKSQKTTYDMYLAKIHELGLLEADYTEMLQMLKDKPDLFLKRLDVRRNDKELEHAMWEFMYTAGDIHDVKLLIGENPQLIDQATYRNIGTHCTNMCAFKNLCQTTIEGGNVSMVLNLGYEKIEEGK